MINPEIRFLNPANKKGGIVSIPMRIPKNVVPQKKATQNKDRYNFVFKKGFCYEFWLLEFDFSFLIVVSTQRLP
jgi:hypothetical protein